MKFGLFKKNFMLFAFAGTMSIANANIASLSEVEMMDHFTIDSVEVTEVELPDYMQVENFVTERLPLDTGFIDGGIGGDIPGPTDGGIPGGGSTGGFGLGSLIMKFENLLAFGKQVMDVVREGKPVVTTNMSDPITVIPRVDGADVTGGAMHYMEGWSFPKAKGFKIALKNKRGKAPIVFHYTVYYQYNGKFEGKGQYLTGINVVASKIYVGWGYDFKASSKLVAISNHGSRDNPVAGATLQISYTASNTFTSITKNEIVHIAGDGELMRAEVEQMD